MIATPMVLSISLFWCAIVFAGLALVTGCKSSDGIYLPHVGYTWSALVALIASIGIK